MKPFATSAPSVRWHEPSVADIRRERRVFIRNARQLATRSLWARIVAWLAADVF